MAGEVDLEQVQRGVERWRILKVLDAGRPQPVSETIILRALQDAELQITPHALRVQLDYLAHRELVTISHRDGPIWAAELTRIGMDVVEYTVPCEPGISRPKKW